MKTVTIFSTPTCVYCKMAKEFFHKHNVEFIEKNVAEDLEAQQDMISRSGQMGVPVIDIDGELIIGFDKPKVMELLEIAE